MHVALARPVRYLLLMIPPALSESETVLALASVPEHSLPFMEAMSGGKARVENGYLFFTGEDWLMAVAYPLTGEYDDDAFEAALRAVLRRVPARQGGRAVCRNACGRT